MTRGQRLARPFAALTVAGSDSGGGAGIQADLRTFAAHGLLGCTALTAVTAQNTLGVSAVAGLEPALVAAQIKAVLDDLPVRAVKTGMLFSAAVIEVVAAALEATALPLVVDPVCVASSGDALIEDDAVALIVDRLMPLAAVVTPNLPECARLLGRSLDEVLAARPEAVADALAARIGDVVVVVKGGHRAGSERCSDLVRYADGSYTWLEAPRIDTRCDHGTGCTFSAAIAANLARGVSLREALRRAKRFVTSAIADAREVGAGRSPVNHLWSLHDADDCEG